MRLSLSAQLGSSSNDDSLGDMTAGWEGMTAYLPVIRPRFIEERALPGPPPPPVAAARETGTAAADEGVPPTRAAGAAAAPAKPAAAAAPRPSWPPAPWPNRSLKREMES